MQFRDLFLTSYTAFANGKDIFNLLVERFDAASSSIHNAGERAVVRYS